MTTTPKPMPKLTRLSPQKIDRWQDQQDELRQHHAYLQTGLGSWGQSSSMTFSGAVEPTGLAEQGDFEVDNGQTPFDEAFQPQAPRMRRRGP